MTTKKETETPETEVTERVTRRQFTDEYKLRILEEAERCNSGELGTLLRREGLYSSYLSTPCPGTCRNPLARPRLRNA